MTARSIAAVIIAVAKGIPPRPVIRDGEWLPQHLELDPARPSFVTVATAAGP